MNRSPVARVGPSPSTIGAAEVVADDRGDRLVVEVVLHDRADLVDAVEPVHAARPRCRGSRRTPDARSPAALATDDGRADLADPGDEHGQVVAELPGLLVERDDEQRSVLAHGAGEPHGGHPTRRVAASGAAGLATMGRDHVAVRPAHARHAAGSRAHPRALRRHPRRTSGRESTSGSCSARSHRVCGGSAPRACRRAPRRAWRPTSGSTRAAPASPSRWVGSGVDVVREAERRPARAGRRRERARGSVEGRAYDEVAAARPASHAGPRGQPDRCCSTPSDGIDVVEPDAARRERRAGVPRAGRAPLDDDAHGRGVGAGRPVSERAGTAYDVGRRSSTGREAGVLVDAGGLLLRYAGWPRGRGRARGAPRRGRRTVADAAVLGRGEPSRSS